MTEAKQQELTFQDLSPYTSLFRGRLLEEFQLLDNITATTQAPQYTSRIVRDDKFFRKILAENPHQLIKFQPLKRTVQHETMRQKDRRLTRARNIDKLPIGAWAAWVVESSAFQYFILALVLMNSLSAALSAEWNNDQKDHYWVLQGLALFDLISIIFYVLEIVLKWIDDFEGFWKDNWNLFDLFVTIASAVPSILEVAYTGQSGTVGKVLQELRSFRIIRTLKLMVRFGNLKIVILTILQTMKSLTVILLLMLIAGFIFGIIGFNLFANYSNWNGAAHDYYWSYLNLPLALFSAFRLITFDSWDASSTDLTSVVSPAVVYTWYFIWLWLGAFIFKNIFVGVVVTDFQRIKEQIDSQKTEFVKQRKMQKLRNKLKKELNVRGPVAEIQPGVLDTAEMVPDSPEVKVGGGLSFGTPVVKTEEILPERAVDEQKPHAENAMITDAAAKKKWSEVVAQTLTGLQGDTSETKWPRDTLFKYFQLMETLQENVAEFQELQTIASSLLLQLHDN